jgi:vancomycin permeability regulator SanA
MNVQGYSATLQEYWGQDLYYIRELFAIYKAYIDVNLIQPKYIGGKSEIDLSK